MTNFTSQQMLAIKEKISRDDVEFFYVPSADIRSRIVKGDDVELNKINNDLKTIILEGHAFKISRDMVIRYIEDTLDKMNTFMLNNGEIRVEGSPSIKFGGKNV